MQIFIAGTDTNIGKTTIASWLCLHTGYDYFKPIQTGSIDVTDSQVVAGISNSKIHPEKYIYKEPCSPHLASKNKGQEINLDEVILPLVENLIVEGAGGVMTPLNDNKLLIDLIKMLSLPVILVASSRLGTINHSLLTLQALNICDIKTLGVIVSGQLNQDNADAIKYYGKTEILMQIPYLENISRKSLSLIKLPYLLKKLFEI